MRLTAATVLPNVSIRAINAKAFYVVGDASGAGFGSAMWSQGSESVDVEFEKWLPTVAKRRSSNFWESANLVQKLQRLIHNGDLPRGLVVYLCTDNGVFKSTYF